ncbi:integrase catalytic domain-containing protein [Trichonephila clavipes]|nr:integrase catalytic domain-containing protein [Trichonephila clavipes]
MSTIKSLKKDELSLVAEELGLDIPQNPKIIVLKNLIERSEIFETVKEFLQSVIDGVLAEKKAKIEQDKQEKFKLESEKAKIEFEKIKLEQLKKELELTNAKCKLSPAQEKSEHFESVPSDIENLIKSIKTLTIPVPSNTEANLFFQLLEKAFKTKNVEDKFKAEILLNMLGEKVGNLMVYVKQEELGDYEKIKQLVLKQFHPTPRVLLNQFRRSQKLPNENYVQFASRIEAMFDYYCKLRNVNEFNELCQLIVADQIINSLDQELTSYINLKMCKNWYTPDKLSRELDLFMSSKVSSRNEINVGFRQNKFFKSGVDRKGLKGVTSVFLFDVNDTKCSYCCENHAIPFCTKFKQLSVHD